MIPKKPAPDLIRGGYRFSETHVLGLDPRDHAPTIRWSEMALRSKVISLAATRAGRPASAARRHAVEVERTDLGGAAGLGAIEAREGRAQVGIEGLHATALSLGTGRRRLHRQGEDGQEREKEDAQRLHDVPRTNMVN